MKFPKIDIMMVWSLAPSLLFATIATLIFALFSWISWWLVFFVFFIVFMLFVYPAVKLENDKYNDNKPDMCDIVDNIIELMIEEDEDETIQKITLDDSDDN
jgi:Ca2+/Na+ antiporter